MEKEQKNSSPEKKEKYVAPVVESITVRVERGFALSVPANSGLPGGDGTLGPNDLGNY